MTSASNRDLLSAGAFLIIVIVSLILALAGLIGWWMVPPLVFLLCGVWVMILAQMQISNPQKYGRGAFSLFSWGLLFVAAGGAWFLYVFNWLYSLILILLAVAALAIAVALRKK